MNREFELAFGEQKILLVLPEDKILNVVEGKRVAAIADVAQAAQAALDDPIGCPPLREVMHPGDTVAIIVSDITRAWIRYDLFLATLLNELNKAGIPDKDIQLVVALGAHRPHTEAENRKAYGKEVVDRVKIGQSLARQSEDFVSIGQTSHGVEVEINRLVANAAKVILTGGITYHSMAGFGGGRKAILPGVSSYVSIQGNHRFCLHDECGCGINPDCDCGQLANNKMHLDQMEMAELVNPAFLLNVVLTPDGQLAHFVAGHWREAWLAGCAIVEDIYGIPVKEQADVTIASAGGFPKDINLYQGSKAIENAAAATKPGGVLIILLECRDIREPSDFSEWFDYSSLQARELALREGFTVPGFIALKLGYIAERISVIMVTLPENKEFIAKTGIADVAVSVEEALQLARQKLGTDDYKIMVMPHATNTVPLLK